MPELPEVETVVRTLRPLVVGKTLQDALIYTKKLIKTPELIKDFKSRIKGQKINAINRIGKHIIFVLDNDVLISHLRMEGKYYFFQKEKEIQIDDKHFMASLVFDDKSILVYHDTRKFGTFHLLPKDKYLSLPPINKVGPEPFDKKCSVKYLKEKFSKKTIAIKSALLDQSIMAGLGNIYVNEVLHLAKINPLQSTKTISEAKILLILKYSKEVLKKAIKLGGSSISSYTSSLGVDGKFQNFLLVHTKKGEKCQQCKNCIIKKIKVNGRGTYYCSCCQK